ncbi:MAG: hypothetical protein U1D55_07440 [Phycisphaerae bacterium]
MDEFKERGAIVGEFFAVVIRLHRGCAFAEGFLSRSQRLDERLCLAGAGRELHHEPPAALVCFLLAPAGLLGITSALFRRRRRSVLTRGSRQCHRQGDRKCDDPD